MSYKQRSPQSVEEGGTGASTLTGVLTGNGTGAVTANTITQYAVLKAGASNAVESTSVGTAGQVITSNGAGADPTYEDYPGVTGPGGSTDNSIARFDGTSGVSIDDSTIIVTDDGEMTNPSQPGFLGSTSGIASNVTGDGTTYTWGTTSAFSEIIDNNGDFNTNGTFTAPIAGLYAINLMEDTRGYTASEDSHLGELVTSNRTWAMDTTGDSLANSSGILFLIYGAVADMDAADTWTCDLTVSGGTKIIDAYSGTFMSGWLLG